MLAITPQTFKELKLLAEDDSFKKVREQKNRGDETKVGKPRNIIQPEHYLRGILVFSVMTKVSDADSARMEDSLFWS